MKTRLLFALALLTLTACASSDCCMPCCRTGSGQAGGPTLGTIIRKDPRFDALIPPNARMEILAGGYEWVEGPVWVKNGGYLLFSVIPPNKICKWKEGEGVSIYLRKSGYSGEKDLREEPGSNGLILDPQGRLVLCQHGDRRMARMEAPLDKPEATFTSLADRYDGKKLNSPNDGCYHSSGALYFTDPPYGLAKRENDPTKELDFYGVYRLGTDGKLTLLTKDITRPNGICFSPDEKILYVGSSDPDKAIWTAFDVKPDGTLGASRIFKDQTAEFKAGQPGLPDGMKADIHGNLFATGPGGVHVFAPDGTLLGTLATGQRTSNCNWGEDGSTLFITADQYIVRIKTTTKGNKF
ncbi:MAG TPA: SMP-30/gluconolactonase/LRE family protein [Planctomycetota bacterium]|nr:SMP-30/gluconolactonase/LRE family protein [Planctomycetota bacterium]